MNIEVSPNDWTLIDRWWGERTKSSLVTHSSSFTRALDKGELVNFWDELGPWWDAYSETGHETAMMIRNLLNRSNGAWMNSNAPFDTDPLATDLTGTRFQRGPLQPRNEVEWSRWLARLLRPSAALVNELFDTELERSPDEVTREEQLAKQDGSFRRPDILIFHSDGGISIEVKLDDENYRKTAETARLVEQHYGDHKWSHSLLLPRGKKGRLDTIVEPSLNSSEDDRPRITWNDPGPVDVMYWCDVTAAIRSILRRGEAVDNHWAANAYLFCTVAEQQLIRFQPQPVIERLAAPANIVDTLQPIQPAGILEEQLTYLRSGLYL